MNTVQTLPKVFPLHADKKFLSESEWVIFKLLCRPASSFPNDDADTLSIATGKQVSTERCDELIRIVQINQLNGLGSWISRLIAETGLSADNVCQHDPATVLEAVNQKAGYKICNDASIRALHDLQQQWQDQA